MTASATINSLHMLTLCLCAVAAAGCTTSKPANFQGGFTTARLARDEFEIRFDGNVGVDAKAMEETLLRRAAEVTLEQGYTYFVTTGSARQAGFNVSLTTDLLHSSRQTHRSIIIRCSPPPGEPGAINAAEWLDAHRAGASLSH